MKVFTRQRNIIRHEAFEKLIEQHGLQPYFTQKEIDKYAHKRSMGSLAARYALKKLVIEEMPETIEYTDLEILNDDKGKPILSSPTSKISLTGFKYSLSHTRHEAAALLAIDDKMFRTLTFECIDDLAVIKLNAPPKNEMSLLFFRELTQIVNFIEDHGEFKGIIITSEGRHFSSGANVEELLGSFDHEHILSEVPSTSHQNTFTQLSEMKIPVVACVRGICYGSAMELALCADIRIAAPNALFAYPESGFGIMPGLGGIVRLMPFVSKSMALELLLGGKSLSAEEAKGIGMVNIICDKSELLNKAISFIQSKQKTKMLLHE